MMTSQSNQEEFNYTIMMLNKRVVQVDVEVLNLIKIFIVFLILIYASIHDLKDRIVPNKVWIFMILSVFPLTLFEFIYFNYGINIIIFSIIQFILISTIAYLFYYFGVYGGADAKAFITLSIIFPIYPEIYEFPILNKGIGIFAFSVLSNSLVLIPFLLVLFFLRNIIKEGTKNLKKDFFYYFIGIKVDARNIPRFYNLLEYVNEEGKIVRVKRGIEPTKDILENIAKNKKIKTLWATPALPFLVFIAFGFLLAVFVGDIIVEIVFQVILRIL